MPLDRKTLDDVAPNYGIVRNPTAHSDGRWVHLRRILGRDMIQLDRIVPELRPLLIYFKSDRLLGESLGDFCNRKGLDGLLQFVVHIVAQQDERNDAVRRNVSQRGGIMALFFFGDGLLAGSTGCDNAIRLCKVGNDERNQLAVLKCHTSKTFELAFSPNGKQLASASSDHSLRLWTIDERPRESEVSRRAHGELGEVSSVECLPDGRSMLVLHSSGIVTPRPPAVFVKNSRLVPNSNFSAPPSV